MNKFIIKAINLFIYFLNLTSLWPLNYQQFKYDNTTYSLVQQNPGI